MLVLVGHTAVHRTNKQIHGFCQGLENIENLFGQLSGGRQYESGGSMRFCLRQILQQGETKGKGLTGACWGTTSHVHAVQQHGNALGLHLKRFGDSLAAEGLNQFAI